VRKVLPIGIDVGASRAKLVQLAASGSKYSVIACAKVDLPNLPGMSAAAREEALLGRIAEKLKSGRFRGSDCISALAADEVSIRNVRVPCVDADDLDRVVRDEAKNKFSFNLAEATLNYLIAGEVHHGEDKRLEVILFASPDQALEAHVARLRQMKLNAVSLDVPQCAMFRTFERYLRRKADENEVNVFIDMGGITTVVITRGRDVLFIKNLTRGGVSFNETVAARLGVTLEEAAALRLKVSHSDTGEKFDPATRQAVLDALRPEIDELAEEINKCLRYHSVTFRGSRPERLTFVGGETHEGSIPALLGERLCLPVVIGQPFRGIDTANLGPDVDRRGMLSEWTVAFGLSLKGAFLNGRNRRLAS
jgi:type IV pilus assembly protein PilM